MLGKIRIIKSMLTHIKADIVYLLSLIKNYQNEEVIFTHFRVHAHALDKGLHIVPFEKGHGKKLYQRSIDLKNKIKDKKFTEDPAFLWATSVVDKYERAQKEGIFIDEEDKIEPTSFTDKDKADFYKIIKSRISCRNFAQEEIKDETWNEIIEIAADAPSGCCRHTERYYIENDSNKIKAIVPNILGASGFNEYIPYLICITADTRPYPIRERWMPYIDVSLSIQNFLLACTVNNIYSTLLNFQAATKTEIENVKKILNIPNYERIILFAAAGKAKKIPLKPARIDVNQIRKK